MEAPQIQKKLQPKKKKKNNLGELKIRSEIFQAEFSMWTYFNILISNEIPFSKFHISGGSWINKSTWLPGWEQFPAADMSKMLEGDKR